MRRKHTAARQDWSSKAILAQNRGGRPVTYKSWTGDCEATRSGPIGLAETRGNGYVVSDTLLEKKKPGMAWELS